MTIYNERLQSSFVVEKFDCLLKYMFLKINYELYFSQPLHESLVERASAHIMQSSLQKCLWTILFMIHLE